MKYNQFISSFVLHNEFSPFTCNEFRSGNNGLYSEQETIFRNMCHWIVLLLDVQDDSLENLKRLWVGRATEILLENKPKYGVYRARNSDKDSSNGLIGSAWILEGVVRLWSSNLISKNQIDAIKTIANEMISNYPWSERQSIWPNIVEPDGTLLPIDRTFNHQLWFAGSNAEVGRALDNEDAFAHARVFVANLKSLMKINSRRLVYHTLGIYPHFHRTLIKRIISPDYRSEMKAKEYGYHAFNLLGFIRLYKIFGGADIEEIILKLLRPCFSEVFWEHQEGNVFGSSYNPVGIEVAVAASHFRNDQLVLKGLNYHFNAHYDKNARIFLGGFDLPTLNARIYEMTYLHSYYKDNLYYSEEDNAWSLNG